eukprot:9573645-Alexandrium_andersonii.AAC.1
MPKPHVQKQVNEWAVGGNSRSDGARSFHTPGESSSALPGDPPRAKPQQDLRGCVRGSGHRARPVPMPKPHVQKQ